MKVFLIVIASVANNENQIVIKNLVAVKTRHWVIFVLNLKATFLKQLFCHINHFCRPITLDMLCIQNVNGIILRKRISLSLFRH